MKSKAKSYCNSKDCSFKPVKFNTFEYMYCSTCKSEVDDDVVEYKAREKAYDNVNPHINYDDDQGDLFDFMP
jgi:hypothetical protein